MTVPYSATMLSLPESPQRLAPLLWLLWFVFVLRVAGQMLVACGRANWLPPMEAWMSGLLPYPYLLPAQFAIITVLAKVSLDSSRGRGWFLHSRPWFGRSVLLFGWIYFASMAVRYAVRMAVRPEERWFGGTIPIFFHFVLSSFIILFGLWHRRRLRGKTA